MALKDNHFQDSASTRKGRLDFLRGIAILGMLVANVPWHVGNSMSRVIDPDFSSVFAWLIQYLLFDSRFLPIFCFLFGAGFYILYQKSGSFTQFYPGYVKRMLVLFLIGVCHAYLFWPGDILITYGVCGCLLLLFHNCSVPQLLIWGASFKTVDLLFGQWPALYQSTLDTWLFAWWFDAGSAPMTAVEAYAGNYMQLFEYNAWRNQFLQWTALPYFRVWNSLGLMLIGIALYRTGILQGDRNARFYWRMFWISIVISGPLIVYGVIARIGENPSVGPMLDFAQTLPLSNLTFRSGCALSAVTIIALVHLVWHRFSPIMHGVLQSVGQMALSNYLLQTIIFFLLFHTFGLLIFDSLDHDTMFLMVLGVWLIHLVFSVLWLKIYRRGPVEILYRKLSAIGAQNR